LDYLKREHPEIKTVFLLGTQSLQEEFSEFGYNVITDTDSDNESDAVIVAFDTSLTYDRLCKTAWWVKRGIPYFATHPDKVCPTDKPTVLIDCGAIADCIASATNRKPDRTFGKPDPAMIEGIIKQNNLQPNEILMVGDRLYTDIAMAHAAKIAGVLVLSGEATRDDVNNCVNKPDILAENIFTLAEAIRSKNCG
jgi:NagD protein